MAQADKATSIKPDAITVYMSHMSQMCEQKQTKYDIPIPNGTETCNFSLQHNCDSTNVFSELAYYYVSRITCQCPHGRKLNTKPLRHEVKRHTLEQFLWPNGKAAYICKRLGFHSTHVHPKTYIYRVHFICVSPDEYPLWLQYTIQYTPLLVPPKDGIISCRNPATSCTQHSLMHWKKAISCNRSKWENWELLETLSTICSFVLLANTFDLRACLRVIIWYMHMTSVWIVFAGLCNNPSKSLIFSTCGVSNIQLPSANLALNMREKVDLHVLPNF